MPTQPLSDIAIQRELGSLPGWARRGDSLVKTFAFRTFPDAIAFATRVADVAQAADHYPDIDIRHIKVTLTLNSDDAGGKVRLAHLRAPLAEGVYRRGGVTLHVSPGLGTTFVPFRFFARPAAYELVLHSAG